MFKVNNKDTKTMPIATKTCIKPNLLEEMLYDQSQF